MTGLGRFCLMAALVGGVGPASAASILIQVVPDGPAPMRVLLDRKVIYEGGARPAGAGAMLPVTVGTFDLGPGRHVLIAEVPATHTRAQLEWGAGDVAAAWAVIHYYPGRPDDLPFIRFSLQGDGYKVK